MLQLAENRQNNTATIFKKKKEENFHFVFTQTDMIFSFGI